MADTTALASLRTKRLCEGKILPLGVSGSQRKIYGEQRGLCSRNIKRKKTLESRKIYLYEHIGYNFSQWRYYWSGNFTKACLSHKKMPRKRSPWWLIDQWTGFVWSVFLLWWRWHGGCPRNSVPAEAHILLCPSRNLCNDAVPGFGCDQGGGLSISLLHDRTGEAVDLEDHNQEDHPCDDKEGHGECQGNLEAGDPVCIILNKECESVHQVCELSDERRLQVSAAVHSVGILQVNCHSQQGGNGSIYCYDGQDEEEKNGALHCKSWDWLLKLKYIIDYIQN